MVFLLFWTHSALRTFCLLTGHRQIWSERNHHNGYMATDKLSLVIQSDRKTIHFWLWRQIFDQCSNSTKEKAVAKILNSWHANFPNNFWKMCYIFLIKKYHRHLQRVPKFSRSSKISQKKSLAANVNVFIWEGFYKNRPTILYIYQLFQIIFYRVGFKSKRVFC